MLDSRLVKPRLEGMKRFGKHSRLGRWDDLYVLPRQTHTKAYLGEHCLAGVPPASPSFSVFWSFVSIDWQCLNGAFHTEVQYY